MYKQNDLVIRDDGVGYMIEERRICAHYLMKREPFLFVFKGAAYLSRIQKQETKHPTSALRAWRTSAVGSFYLCDLGHQIEPWDDLARRIEVGLF